MVLEKYGGILVMGSWVLLNIFLLKKVCYYIWCFVEKRMIKYFFGFIFYVIELCVGLCYMGNIYYLEDFKFVIFVLFEDIKMLILVGYKCYLIEVFGDYM